MNRRPTPKETAVKLVEEYFPIVNGGESYPVVLSKAKKCALIAVNLRIESYTVIPVGSMEWAEKKESYWQEVKKEIENL